MLIRSLLLFAHLIGMLLLFIALALEGLSLGSPWAKLRERLPRVYGIALGLTLLSGIILAARIGVHQFIWVRASLIGLVLIGITGAVTLRRISSHSLARASLYARVAAGLVIVYLMIAKPV